ncbi:MAG TPA: OsmC family peroxiredoxin [Vicinamibacterales bacterium]|nr:OsmC family peroxiredoxin [Vicinamibacterales bacterium]
MATFERHVDVDWSGSIMEGKGTAKAGTGAFNLPVTFPRRVGDPEGTTSPEELIAAAHAACYAMALNATLGRKNAKARRTRVAATVVADKGEAGITITTSRLKVVAEGLEGMTAEQFTQTAREAESKCPVSVALRSIKIEIEASVA